MWARLAPYLQSAGFTTHAVDLPGNGADGSDPADVTFEACLQHVYGITPRSRPASEFDRSFGRRTTDHRLRRTLAHMCLEAGVCRRHDAAGRRELRGTRQDNRSKHPEATGIWPHLEWSADRRVSRVPAKVAIDFFLQDCPEEDAAAAAARLTPQGEGGRAVTTPATASVMAVSLGSMSRP